MPPPHPILTPSQAKLCMVQCAPSGPHNKATEHLETTADRLCTAMVPKATGLWACLATLSHFYNLLAVLSPQKTFHISPTLFRLLPPLPSLTATWWNSWKEPFPAPQQPALEPGSACCPSSFPSHSTRRSRSYPRHLPWPSRGSPIPLTRSP